MPTPSAHESEAAEPVTVHTSEQKDHEPQAAGAETTQSDHVEVPVKKASIELEIVPPSSETPLLQQSESEAEPVSAAETVTVTASSLDELLSPTTTKPPTGSSISGVESPEETEVHDELQDHHQRASTAGTEFTELGELEDVRLSTATDVEVLVPLNEEGEEEEDVTQAHTRNTSVESASSLDAIKSVRSSVPTELRRRSTLSSTGSDFEYRNPLAESRDYLNEDQVGRYFSTMIAWMALILMTSF
jgi:hypothetical protein